ncbi:hypothetical protein ACFO0S_08020 [Chryseomicrobium palamuruense]|uniref:Uncharacterized protein n=1 Tax=Chryseomicrobium palamuruense TaxID=682973 RepID=A0ABV8UVL2_9BACL
MIFWLPIFLLLFFLTVQATFAEMGVVRYSLLAISTHTIIVFVFFTDHPLTWFIYILTIQMWALFVVTLYRRNKWREGKLI